LAEKARRKETLTRKRKEREDEQQSREQVAKKARIASAVQTAQAAEAMKTRALSALESQLVQTGMELDSADLQRLGAVQRASAETMADLAEHEAKREQMEKLRLTGTGMFGDDYDCRLVA